MKIKSLVLSHVNHFDRLSRNNEIQFDFCHRATATYAILCGLLIFFFLFEKNWPFSKKFMCIEWYVQQTFAFIRSFYDVALRPAISTLLMKIHTTCFAAMARFSISSFQPDTEEDIAKKNNTHLPRRIINDLS